MELHNSFSHKILTGAFFLLALCASLFGASRFFYWLHERAACCYIGIKLGKRLHHNFPFRLTDGTPHSSSDFLYFTPFLLFTFLDKIILSPIPLPSSPPSLKFLSPFPNLLKHSMSKFLSDLEIFPPFCLPLSYSCRYSLNSVH